MNDHNADLDGIRNRSLLLYFVTSTCICDSTVDIYLSDTDYRGLSGLLPSMIMMYLVELALSDNDRSCRQLKKIQPVFLLTLHVLRRLLRLYG